MSGGGLKSWWKRFDAYGRKFIVDASPILGSGPQERKILEELERQKRAREQKNG